MRQAAVVRSWCLWSLALAAALPAATARAAGPAAAPAGPPPPVPELIPAAVDDDLESRTGGFAADYPAPPEKLSGTLVQVVVKRGGLPVIPPTRTGLFARSRKEERENPAFARGGGPGGKPAAPKSPAAPATKPVAPVAVDDGPADPWRFSVYVPASYKPGKLFGLIVWISPGGRGDIPGPYKELCDRHRLIWIGPADVGNDRYVPWRRYMSLEAVAQARRHFTIDAQRVYASGASGGGRMASEVSVLYADLFTGGFPLIGANAYRNIPVPDQPNRLYPGFWTRPDTTILNHAKRDGRYVLLTGTKDFNREGALLVHDAYTADKFAHLTYLEVPDMGHTTPPAEWFDKGLDALDAPLASAADLAKQAADFDKQGKAGDAYLAYARAAARGGDVAEAKEWDTKAAALYAEYSGRVAKAAEAVKAGRADPAAAEVKALRVRFGPMAEARAAALSDALKPKPAPPAGPRP